MRLLTYFFLLLNFSLTSYAIETITINRGHADPIPIAINHFDADNSANNTLGQDMTTVIMNDLRHSGLFRPISLAAFIEQKKGVDYTPLFAAWRQINANFLLNGVVTKLGGGKLHVGFVLWDTILEKEIANSSFQITERAWRRAAHKIADEIYKQVTGEEGYFDTKVVYVSETGSPLKRIKRIAIMDYDGFNHRYLTDGKNLVLTPRFSPNADKILYLSYVKRRTPRVYMLDLKTGKETVLGNFPGMSFAPRFSPDGNEALMSIAKGGSTHIYKIDLRSMKIQRLTTGYSINTSPSYSPDGRRIVFNSDRSGSRQLYVMNADGSGVERISFGGGKYTAPSWSPRGDYIAFTKLTRGEGFTIGVMRPNSPREDRGERIIASGYLVEGPCWAPNGRVIMFNRGEPSRGRAAGKTRIYSIDLTGYNEREVPTLYDASDPEWSQVLN